MPCLVGWGEEIGGVCLTIKFRQSSITKSQKYFDNGTSSPFKERFDSGFAAKVLIHFNNLSLITSFDDLAVFRK